MNNSNIVNKEKELLIKLEKLVLKLAKRKNYYEIFNLFFITENILTKDTFNNILNKLDDNTKIKLLEKMVEVNDIKNFDAEYLIIDTKKYVFNNQMNKFIKKIDFLS